MADAAGRQARAGRDHRHHHRFLVERGLAPDTAGTQVVAVVGGVDHQRVVHEAVRLQCRHQPADVVVLETAEAVVGDEGRTALLRTPEVLLVAFEFGVGLYPRMPHIARSRVQLWLGDPPVGVEIVELRGRDQREMGCDQSDIEDKRLTSALCCLLQPLHGPVCDRSVVIRVGRFAPSDPLAQHPGSALSLQVWVTD